MPLSDDLKKAIGSLSHKEKDKLLFRLLRKDPDLCERLQFELVEQGDTLQQRREQVAEAIERQVQFEPYSPGYLMMDMRAVNGMITRHVKYTKDKEGEVQLTLLLLRRFLEEHLVFIVAHLFRADTLQDYLVKRMLFVLQKLDKLHEDLYVEYEEDVNYVLQQLHGKVAIVQAQKAKMPRNWPK
ncbi:hypothetical protein [Pontibacter anaerobius]|uniref:Uncharacterized protein n=1 Tax=Pontibacter anaerobius TaxID=2993940 RepID=A0ABT3RH04_9BACT|nr:hypothetical protein [Pontibacter anaerobius]MCX2741050.1 hypothetical protein [Pontibacter anaerobius]